eukprot:g8091.t1
MNSAMPDDELWRRAFSANAGLFFDAPATDGLGLLSVDDGGACLADRVPSPAPIVRSESNVAPLAPIPAMELAAPVAQNQQHQQQQQLQQPLLRVQVRGRLAEERPPQPRPTLPQQHQQRIIAAPAVSVPVLGAATTSTVLPAASPAANEPSSDQGTPPTQRGGESFARKRDRAKLLRQQMNDGLDNLHEALVEISASGANPSASAATNLIPTRGPRRAAVVACSAGLVRELISTCVTLRAEKASVSNRLSAALAAVAVLQQQQQQKQQQQQQGAGVSLASPQAGCGAADGAGGQLEAAKKRRDDGATHGEAGGASAAGEVSAKVFGQLLSLSVFGFLGPQSLKEGRKVSREWRDKCTWDCNWSNLCVSRWRLGPEQRHAEVWRVPDKGNSTAVARTVVSPPAPPPSWQSIYSRLQRNLRAPTGAFSPSHKIIGRSVQEGVAVWIALNRRSNGMTGRSVMGHGSSGFRTTEVIELRAVVQRVEEGQAVRVHPRAFVVRQVSGLRAYISGDGRGSGSTAGGGIIATTGVFPPVSQGEDRFSPRFVVNTGAPDAESSSSSCCNNGNGAPGLTTHGVGGGGVGMGSWLGTAAEPAAKAATPPLALYEYAAVDFFIEAAGCPTEADFLRLEACVDVAVSGAAARGAPRAVGGGGDAPQVQKLSVGLTEGTPPPASASAFGLHAMGVEMGRPIKRRF